MILLDFLGTLRNRGVLEEGSSITLETFHSLHLRVAQGTHNHVEVVVEFVDLVYVLLLHFEARVALETVSLWEG